MLFGVPEQPQGPAGRAGRPAGPGRHGPQAGRGRGLPRGRRPRSAAGRRLRRRPGTTIDQVAGRRWAAISRRLRPAGAAARPSTASCSASPARWSGWPRRRPSPTPTGSASTASRTSIRSSRSSSPRPRSTTTWRRVKLADSLSMYLEMAGARRPAGPEGAGRQVARRSGRPSWSRGTKLADVAVRKQLAEGGMKAIEASDDPMIQLARLVDAPARERPQDLRAAGRGAAAPGLRQDGQRPLRALRHRHLSRRHVHAAAGVRHW